MNTLEIIEARIQSIGLLLGTDIDKDVINMLNLELDKLYSSLIEIAKVKYE